MATLRLGKREIDKLPLPEKTTYYFDSELKGFGLKVTPTGTRTFILEYRPGTGGRAVTKKRLTLGRYGALSPDEARGLAKAALAQVIGGSDPQSEKQRLRAELTVSDLCDLYLREGCNTKKPSTLATDRGRIERHIKPLLGKKKVSELVRSDVERFLRDVAAGKTAADVKTVLRGRAIVEGGKGTATRTTGLLGGIMSFALARGLRQDNPVRGVKRYTDKKGERFLSNSELGKIGDALSAMEAEGSNPSAVAIIRLLALTGARKSEIASLKWEAVDLERHCLRLADSKTGAKVIPLGAPALEILAGWPRSGGSPFVFPGAKGEGPFQGTDKVWRQVRERAGMPALRMHDLRHSFASIGLARGDTLSLIGAILGHADVKTTSRYAHLADDPVRAAADGISRTIAATLLPRAHK